MPPNFAPILLIDLVLTILASAAGALIVTINSQPTTLIWAYLGAFVFVIWVSDGKHITGAMLSAAVLSIVSIITCAFLLERRCAT